MTEVVQASASAEEVRSTLNFLEERKLAYSLTFGGVSESKEATRYVLKDLAKFCFFSRADFDADALKLARIAGRKDVLLRIVQHMQLPVTELFRLASGFEVDLGALREAEQVQEED